MKHVADYAARQHVHLGDVRDPQTGRPSKLIAVGPQIIFQNNKKTVLEQSPAATPSTLYTAASTQVDIIIPAKSTGRITDLAIKQSVTETSAADIAVPVIAPYYFDERAVEIYARNGSQLLQTYYNDALVLDMMMLEPWQLTAVCNLCNMNTSTYLAPAASITASSTTALYVPFINNILTRTGLDFQRMNSDVVLRLHYRQVYASALTASVPLKMIAETMEHVYEERKMHDKMFGGAIHRYVYLEPVRLQQSGTVTASTTYNIDLNSLPKCKVSHFAVLMRAGRGVGSNAAGTWASIGITGSVNVVSDTGDKVLSNNAQTFRELKYFEVPKQTRNAMGATLNPIIINFSQNIPKSYLGQMNGFLDFPGSKNYQIQVTPDSAWATGTFYIDTYAYVFKTLTVYPSGEMAVAYA